MLKNRKYVSLSLPPEKIAWMEEQCKKEYLAKSRLVEKALDEYRERHCNDDKIS